MRELAWLCASVCLCAPMPARSSPAAGAAEAPAAEADIGAGAPASAETSVVEIAPVPDGSAAAEAALGTDDASAQVPLADEVQPGEVVVVGRRPAATASEHRVEALRLLQVPARTAEDLIQLVPGLHVVQHGSEGKGHQFFLRGFDAVHGSDLQVSVEGVPMNEHSNVHGHGYVDLGFLVPEVVQAIDARKGAYALEQGDFATAGSIDFELGVAPEDQGVRASYQAGTTHRHRGLVLWAPGDRDFLALEGVRDDGFGENRHLRRGTIVARKAFDLGGDGTLTGLAAASVARFGLPGALRREDVSAGRVGFHDAYLQDTGGTSRRAFASFVHELRDNGFRARTQVFAGERGLLLDENYTGDLSHPVEGDRRRQTQDGIEGGAETRLARRVGPDVELRLVGSLRLVQLEQREELLDREGGPFAVVRDHEFTQQSYGVGLGVGWKPLESLKIQAGLRLDAAFASGRDRAPADSEFPVPFEGGASVISPRLSLASGPHADWHFFAAYGRGLRSPEARAFGPRESTENERAETYEGGEPDFTVSDDAEVGVRFQPGPAIDAGLAAFAILIARESVFDHTSGVNVERGGTQRHGLELDVAARPLPWVELDADATLADARFTSDGAPVPGAPRLLATAGTTLGWAAGWRASAHLLWLGARPLAHGAQAGDVWSLDAGAGYRGAFYDVRLDLENVFDRRTSETEVQYASHWDPEAAPSRIPVLHTFAAAPRNARVTLTAWF